MTSYKVDWVNVAILSVVLLVLLALTVSVALDRSKKHQLQEGCPTCGRPNAHVDEDEEWYWRVRMENEWTQPPVITLGEEVSDGE